MMWLSHFNTIHTATDMTESYIKITFCIDSLHAMKIIPNYECPQKTTYPWRLIVVNQPDKCCRTRTKSRNTDITRVWKLFSCGVDNAYWWSGPDKSYFAALSFNDSGVGMGYISKIWVLGCPAPKVGWVQPIKSFIWSQYFTKQNTVALDTTAGEEIVFMKTFLSTGGPAPLGLGRVWPQKTFPWIRHVIMHYKIWWLSHNVARVEW